jgi:hypothetical protein
MRGKEFHIGFWSENRRGKMKCRGRSRRRCKYDVKTDVKGIRWGMDWDRLVQNGGQWRPAVNKVKKLRLP